MTILGRMLGIFFLTGLFLSFLGAATVEARPQGAGLSQGRAAPLKMPRKAKSAAKKGQKRAKDGALQVVKRGGALLLFQPQAELSLKAAPPLLREFAFSPQGPLQRR